MWKKVAVGTLVGVLVLGMLMVPAAASHVDTDAGKFQAVAVSGSSWTGCDDGGFTSVWGTSGAANPNLAVSPNHWSYFEMGNSGQGAFPVSLMDGAIGTLHLCARLDVAPARWHVGLYGNSGNECVISDGKGSIDWQGENGREKLWLRNVRSHRDVMEAVQPLMGEVVAAPDAATAATMTAHHYIYIEFKGAPCYGYSAWDTQATYRIVDQDQSELPLLCEDGWENGCLYGPGPSEWPPL